MNTHNRRQFIGGATAMLVASPLLAQAPASAAQRKWAIVVGVNEYNLAPDLRHCVADAAALASAFRSLGFESVQLLSDDQPRNQQPTKEFIQSAIAKIVQEAQPADLVVVAFSGHGVGVDGRSWLCPMEANLDRAETTMIAVDKLVDDMLRCSARQRVLLFDACRSAGPGDGRAVVVEGLADWKIANRSFVPKISLPRNQELALLASCDDGQESYEDDQLKHGVFTHFLLEAMQGRAVDDDGYVEISHLFTRVREKTKDTVRDRFGHAQTPVQSGYFGAIRLGKFITLIDEDFSKVDIGGLPIGPWDADPDILVDFDPNRKKILCATGDGGWAFARGIQVSGEFELRCQIAYNRERGGSNHTWIAFDQQGAEQVPGIVSEWNPYEDELSVWFGLINTAELQQPRYQQVNWASKSLKLKGVGLQRQVELELIVRRELVRRGLQTAARYKVIINGDEENPITVSRPDVTSFDQVGFLIHSDRGNDRVQGIRRIQLMPVIGR